MRRARTAFQWKDVSAERTVCKDRAGRVVSFIRADHIGRPVFATNAAGIKTWTASYLPFGGVRTTTERYFQADPLGLINWKLGAGIGEEYKCHRESHASY